MKTKNTPVPNNYSLFGVTTRIIVELLANYSLFRINYSNICGTTRQLHVFLDKLLIYYNYPG